MVRGRVYITPKKKEPFILIPNCSIVAWRLPGYSESGASDTDGTPYREIVEEMLDYYDKVGASEQEIMTNKLVCVDGTGGGSVLEIAWAFKTSREVIQGNIDREFLATEEFDETFYNEVEKIRDADDNSKEDKIVNEYCNFVSDGVFDAKAFKINEYLSLALENEMTNIYVGGDLFKQCKYLFINLPKKAISSFNDIESIDEAADFLDNTLERYPNGKYKIPPETEFWGHCSNLQVWFENNYDTKILHRNLSFSLLRKLTEVGDPLAKTVYKSELAGRMETDHLPTFSYIIANEDFFRGFSHEELISLYNSEKIRDNFIMCLKSEEAWLRKNAIDFIHFKFREKGAQLLMNVFYDILSFLDKQNFETLCRVVPLYINRGEVTNLFKMNSEILEFILRELQTSITKGNINYTEFLDLFDGVTWFFRIFFENEIRYYDLGIYTSKIQEYYSQLNCDIEITLLDGEYYDPYKVMPKNKPYYIDKSEESWTMFSVSRELKKVFFPDEYIIVDGIEQWYGSEEPMRLTVYPLIFEDKCLRYFKDTIEPLMGSFENSPQETIDHIISLITEAALPIEGKSQVTYQLISFIFYHKLKLECRFFEYSKFQDILTQYYNQKNSDVEFEIGEGEWIYKYLVKPRDKDYYYNLAEKEEGEEEGERAFKELKKILFPDENIKIARVEQWESTKNPYRFYVQADFLKITEGYKNDNEN